MFIYLLLIGFSTMYMAFISKPYLAQVSSQDQARDDVKISCHSHPGQNNCDSQHPGDHQNMLKTLKMILKHTDITFIFFRNKYFYCITDWTLFILVKNKQTILKGQASQLSEMASYPLK